MSDSIIHQRNSQWVNGKITHHLEIDALTTIVWGESTTELIVKGKHPKTVITLTDGAKKALVELLLSEIMDQIEKKQEYDKIDHYEEWRNS